MAERAELEAETRVRASEVAKLEELLPLAEDQVKSRTGLVEKGINARLAVLEYKERHLGMKRDLKIARDEGGRVKASLEANARRLDQTREEFARSAAEAVSEAADETRQRTEELRKARERGRWQALTAPVSGTVQQLAVHTEGGVVQPAEALLVVVPQDTELVAEILLANKDVGFVLVGAPVELKLETFPFTTYGVIDGTVEWISADAVFQGRSIEGCASEHAPVRSGGGARLPRARQARTG